jgi:hypothetical protein
LNGLHPRQRNSLVFCDRSRSYVELDNMCVYAHNIDGNHQNDPANLDIREAAPPSSGQAFLENGGSHRSHVVCYRFNKPGHMRRDSRVRLPATASAPLRPSNHRS